MTLLDREVTAILVDEVLKKLPTLDTAAVNLALADPTTRRRVRLLVDAQRRKLGAPSGLTVEVVGYGWMKAVHFPRKGAAS